VGLKAGPTLGEPLGVLTEPGQPARQFPDFAGSFVYRLMLTRLYIFVDLDGSCKPKKAVGDHENQHKETRFTD
jgi:hypothetical protein